MHALLINYVFAEDGASGALRWRRMIKYLSRRGWTFDVVARGAEARVGDAGELGIDVPGLRRVALAPDPRRIKLESIDWIWPALRGVRALVRGGRHDLLVSSSTPGAAHFVGWLASLCLRRPWVADFRDPFINANVVTYARPWQIWFLRRAERQVVRRALLVVANTQQALRKAQSEHPRHASKIVAVPNGADPDELEGIVPRRGAARFQMVYAGRFYEGRLPDPLLAALGLLKGRAPDLVEGFRLVLVGPFSRRYTAPHDPALAADLAARFGVADLVEATGNVPHREALAHLLGADALLLFHFLGQDVPFIPGKLYEYLQVGRPIFAITDPQGEAGQILEASGLAAAVGTTDPPAIAEALAGFLERCRCATALPWRPNPAVAERYRSDRLAELFDSLVRGRIGSTSAPERRRSG